MRTPMKSIAIVLAVFLVLTELKTCSGTDNLVDPIVEGTLRTSSFALFFLPPPYGVIVGSIATLGIDIYYQLRKASKSGIDLQSVIGNVSLLIETKFKTPLNYESSMRDALNDVLISKGLIDEYDFLDSCYRDMCTNCFINNHTCPKSSYKVMLSEMLQESSSYRTALSGFVHNYVAAKSTPPSGTPIFRIFEIAVEKYAKRAEQRLNCGYSQTEHDEIFSTFKQILHILQKSYSYVLLASINKYNEDVAMNRTIEAEKRLNATVKIIDNLYKDITRVTKEVNYALNETSRDIRPCDAPKPIRGKTWERLTNSFQIQLFSGELKYSLDMSAGSAFGRAAIYNIRDQTCPSYLNSSSELSLRMYQIVTDIASVNNCTSKFKDVNVLTKERNNPERRVNQFGVGTQIFSFGEPVFEYEQQFGVYYITNETNLIYQEPCYPILCTVDGSDDESSLYRFSTDPVIAQPDYYVTGVRMVIINKTIHLQIREGKFEGDEIDRSSLRWTENNSPPNNYITINHTYNTVRLDDVSVPPGYYVTGVAFAEDEGKITISVYGSNGNSQEAPKVFNRTDPMNERTKINLYNAAPSDLAPPQLKNKIYSNKNDEYEVDFQPSSIIKDAGQTTIPYLDIQEVVTDPPSAVGGIGIYYKGATGYGGYIGMKLLSEDITNRPNHSNVTTYHHGIDDAILKMQAQHSLQMYQRLFNTLVETNSNLSN